jgi:hypothetical protein
MFPDCLHLSVHLSTDDDMANVCCWLQSWLAEMIV